MGVILGVLGTILLGLLLRWLSVEIGVWHKPLCHWFVKIATNRLPEGERLAAQSEWLAIIEDLRSPTAQLLHSFSFLASAFRIRKAIDQEEARAHAFAIRVALAATGLSTVLTIPVAAAFRFFYFADKTIEELLPLPLTPTRFLAIITLVSVVSYLNYQVVKWRYKRRRRLRAANVERPD